MSYFAVHSEGGLLPLDVLERVGREELSGQKAADFGLPKGARLTDEIAIAWSDAVDQWDIFKRHQARVAAEETGTTVTRERWMLPLLMQSLGYADLTFQQAGAQVEGKLYPVSHRAGKGDEGPPVHIEGFRVDLDRRPPAGHRRLSPHALVQEYLNREEGHLWGIVTNSLRLRLLRDTSLTSRPTYLEFDLESILEGNRYNEFALFYRLCHRTRLPRDGEDPTKCFLEAYYQEAIEQGGRVRDKLRDGVVEALKIFGSGFLQHPANAELREKLQSGKLPVEQYHQQLLRLVYRLLFLMVAEERHMIVSCVPPVSSPAQAVAAVYDRRLEDSTHPAAHRAALQQDADRLQHIYDHHYSVTRLRERAEHVFEKSPYADLWLGLKKTFRLFSDGVNSNPLAIPPLNGDLFGPHAMRDLEETHLYNDALVQAIRHLSLFEDNRVRRRVNYAALDVEEMGSVYESLLDFHPAIEDSDEGLVFVFRTGTERKSTGSYYTRPELVRELIESALVPVMEERLAKAVAPGFSPASADLKVGATSPKERAILSMTVCDPACGSGHFLLAAARRLGRELAKIRTGEEEPTPKEFHLAVRDVISHCIYGVDVNPLAVDLCKLSLWLEGHWTGKPLSFLDHHIKCGNSLIGVFDPEVLRQGIPDEAFNPVTGDDKKAAAAIRKRNKKERESPTRRLPFERTALGRLEDLAHQLGELSNVAEDSPADVKRKAEVYRRIHDSPETHRTHRAANLWTAAFFAQPTRPDDPTVPTTESLRQFIESGTAYGPMIGQGDSLALKHRFFHWFLEFPEVFAGGGFDVVLGNPPWERIKLQEEEFFASHDTKIARAPNKAARQKLIAELAEKSPALAQEFTEAKRSTEAASKFVRGCARYPLTAVGDLNTYALFAELARQLDSPQGRAGIIVPTGIATDDTCKAFFGDLNDRRGLASLYDFENREGLFPDVDSRMKFSLLTMSAKPVPRGDFAFFSTRSEHLRDPQRRFLLTPEDFTLLNPNTRTCAVFRTRADAELTKKIYQRVPLLVNERTDENPWGVQFLRMFDMANDSGLFRNMAQLAAQGFSARSTRFQTADQEYLALYEGKMFQQYDHRAASVVVNPSNVDRQGQPLPSTHSQHLDPTYSPVPEYWVNAIDVRSRYPAGEILNHFLSFKAVTSATNERTVLAAFIPFSAIHDNAPIVFLHGQPISQRACFLANLNSIVLDFVARQKTGNVKLMHYVFKQLAVLAPDRYSGSDVLFIVAHVLELTYSAWDIKALADDLWRDSDENLRRLIRCRWEENKEATGGHEFRPPEWAEIAHDGIPLPPFKWDEERRARLRAELDAYYAHLYGLTRDELRYILDPKDVYGPDFPSETFRVLKEKEERLYGEYRTRRLVLEAFDKLAGSPRFRDEMPKRVSAFDVAHMAIDAEAGRG